MKEKYLFILVILVLITGPALAGGVNVANESGFGLLIKPTLTSTSPAGVPFGFAITVDARVYLENGIYTYVYGLSDNGTGTHPFFGTSGISSFSIAAPDFDPSLGWGTVGNVPSNLTTTFVGGIITFQFSPGLPSGDTPYTVYAQSTMAPLLYSFSGFGLGPTGEGAVTWGADPPLDEHLYVAEAPSLLFLGIGLLSVVGMGFFRQKFS